MTKLRGLMTPLTFASFLLMAITGLTMFFGWDRGLTAVVHQWFSWIFLAGAVGHVTTNLRPLRNHLQRLSSKASLATLTIVAVASLYSWGLVTGPQLQKPIKTSVIDAPLWLLAGLTRSDVEALLHRLKAGGIDANSHQTVREISVGQNVGVNRLLAIIFLRG